MDNPRLRGQVTSICDQAQRFLAFLDQHPEKEAWRPIVRECLQSTLRIVERYAQLSRFFDDPGRQCSAQEQLEAHRAAASIELRKWCVDVEYLLGGGLECVGPSVPPKPQRAQLEIPRQLGLEPERGMHDRRRACPATSDLTADVGIEVRN